MFVYKYNTFNNTLHVHNYTCTFKEASSSSSSIKKVVEVSNLLATFVTNTFLICYSKRKAKRLSLSLSLSLSVSLSLLPSLLTKLDGKIEKWFGLRSLLVWWTAQSYPHLHWVFNSLVVEGRGLEHNSILEGEWWRSYWHQKSVK